MLISVFIEVLLFSLVSGAAYDDRLCKEKKKECGDFSYISERASDPGMEEFLKTNCSTLLENVKCQMNLQQKCPLTEENFEFKTLQGFFNVFTVICDEKSALRKAFFRNHECYQKNVGTKEICEKERFEPVLNYVRWENNSTNVEEELYMTSKFLCLHSTLKRYCIVRRMDLDCGREAAIVANEMLYLLDKGKCPDEMNVIWLDQIVEFLWNNFSKDKD